jgi:hypothetical protein
VNIKRIIQRRIRHERNSRTHVSTRSRQRIVQRSGRTTYVSDDATRGGDQMRSKEDLATEEEPESKAEEDDDRREPMTPAIDDDVAGSVNAALHDDDE